MFVARFFFYAAAALALGAASALAQQAAAPVVNRRALAGGTRPLVSSIARPPVASLTETAEALPPLPAGVEALTFAEFFKMPVGPRGLEPAERLRALDGKRVRLVGYFVFEDWASCSCPPGSPIDVAPKKGRPAPPAWMKHVVPGRAMLAPRPVAVSLGHYGLSDDLPPQVAFLQIADRFGEPVFYRPGIYAVTGTLSLGNRDEPDGRVSFVRLQVERDSDIAPLHRSAAAAPAAKPALSQNTNPTQP